LYVCLDSLKVVYALVFSLLFWLLFVCQWTCILFAPRKLFLSFVPICECKSMNYFWCGKIFWRKI